MWLTLTSPADCFVIMFWKSPLNLFIYLNSSLSQSQFSQESLICYFFCNKLIQLYTHTYRQQQRTIESSRTIQSRARAQLRQTRHARPPIPRADFLSRMTITFRKSREKNPRRQSTLYNECHLKITIVANFYWALSRGDPGPRRQYMRRSSPLSLS